MGRIASYLRALISEPLYWRVSIGTFGAMLVVLAGCLLMYFRETDAFEWVGFLLFSSACGCYGAYILYAATFGSDETFEKAIRHGDVGTDILGFLVIILVAFIAMPITIVLKLFRRHAP